MWWRSSLLLRLGWVDNSTHEQKAAGTMFIDQKQKGTVDNKANLSRKRHEPDVGYCPGLRAFLVHSYCALMIELFKQTGKGKQTQKEIEDLISTLK